MKQTRLMPRVVLLALLVLTGMFSGATGGQALAQSATSFVSPMTGISIDTSGPWTVDTGSLLSDSGIESVTVMGQYEFMQVWFMPGNTDLVQARDIVLDSFATTFESFHTIDRGAYGNVSYSLDMTSSDGIEFGVFSLFLGQRSSGYVEYYVYFGAVPVFANGFASAQQNVRVGGNAVFDGVDGTGLQNFLNQNAGATGASPQTGTTTAPPAPEPTRETQTTAPTEPAGQTTTTTGTTSSAEGDAYLAAIDAELTALEASEGEFLLNLLEALDGTPGAAEKVVEIVNYWESYPTTAAAITAPAGYETIDAAYQELAGQVALLGPDARGIVEAIANGDQAAIDVAMASFSESTGVVRTQIASVRGLIEEASTGTTGSEAGTTVEPTEEVVATETTQTGTTAGADGDAYVQAISSEIGDLRASFVDFGSALDLATSDDPADQDTAIAELDRILNYWGSYEDVAATMVAPAGYEDVDAAYQDVASQMPALVTGFIGFLEAEDDATRSTALETFNQQFTSVQDDIDALEAMLGPGGTTTSPSEDPVEEPVEDPGVELDESELDISETGSRGQIPRGDEGDDPEEETETRGGSSTEGGNSRSRGSSADQEELGLVADDEYLSPQFGIEVVWDDRWEFDPEIVDEPIGSDEETASDWITLSWVDGQGDVTVSLGTAEQFEPDVMVSYWESEEYLADLPAGTEVLLSESGRDRGGVMLLVDDGQSEIVIYLEAVCLDRQCEDFALVTVFTTADDAETIIADAEEGIDVGGDGATGVFSSREIRQALD